MSAAAGGQPGSRSLRSDDNVGDSNDEDDVFFVDALLSRVLTDGVFQAIVERTVESRLQHEVEVHTDDATAARSAAINNDERAALLRTVHAHNIDRAMLEEKVRLLHERLDAHGPLHAEHQSRHASLQADHDALRAEHDALKQTVADLTAATATANVVINTLSVKTEDNGSATSSTLVQGESHESNNPLHDHVAELRAQLDTATEKHKAHAAELDAERKARVAMEAQLNQLHLRVEDLVRQLGESTATHTSDSTAGSSATTTSTQGNADPDSEAAAAALKRRLAERRKATTAATPTALGSDAAPPPANTSRVKEKLAERRRAQEAEEARLAAEAAEAAAVQAAKAAADACAPGADGNGNGDDDADTSSSPRSSRKLTRRKSAVMLLVPNPQWDVALLTKHPMEGLAKFLRTNRFRVVDLFNAMDKDKDG